MRIRDRYKEYLEVLEDDQLYTPSSAAKAIMESNDLNDLFLAQRDKRNVHRMLRVNIAVICRRNSFPILGDGYLIFKERDVYRAWYGWRYKGLALPKGYQSVKSLARDLMRQKPARPAAIAMHALLLKHLLPDDPFWNEFNQWLTTANIGPLPSIVM